MIAAFISAYFHAVVVCAPIMSPVLMTDEQYKACAYSIRAMQVALVRPPARERHVEPG
jgi:hypothetical protein